VEQVQPGQKCQGGEGRCDRTPAHSPMGRLGTRLVLAVLLGLGGVWLPQLVAPPVAEAYTSRLNLFLVRAEGESFEGFVQRAEIITRAAVQRSFDADLLMTDVIVTVIGESQSIAMPVLTVAVSRSNWRLQPDVIHWVTYYDAARTLLP
jgi:hypothetical protein